MDLLPTRTRLVDHSTARNRYPNDYGCACVLLTSFVTTRVILRFGCLFADGGSSGYSVQVGGCRHSGARLDHRLLPARPSLLRCTITLRAKPSKVTGPPSA